MESWFCDVSVAWVLKKDLYYTPLLYFLAGSAQNFPEMRRKVILSTEKGPLVG